MTCTRSVRRRRGLYCCYCCCRRHSSMSLKPRFRRRSRVQPLGVRCTTMPGDPRPRNLPWHLQDDQSRRRATRGLFARGLVKSTPKRERQLGDTGNQNGHIRWWIRLTSLRSSHVGMLHSNDLSSRPGRRRAESIRSGRLKDDEAVNDGPSEQDAETP